MYGYQKSVLIWANIIFMSESSKFTQSVAYDNWDFSVSLTLCIRQPPKQVLLQTVKIQMKCSIMLHFIRFYTVCKSIVSKQKEESISIQRVKCIHTKNYYLKLSKKGWPIERYFSQFLDLQINVWQVYVRITNYGAIWQTKSNSGSTVKPVLSNHSKKDPKQCFHDR